MALEQAPGLLSILCLRESNRWRPMLQVCNSPELDILGPIEYVHVSVLLQLNDLTDLTIYVGFERYTKCYGIGGIAWQLKAKCKNQAGSKITRGTRQVKSLCFGCSLGEWSTDGEIHEGFRDA